MAPATPTPTYQYQRLMVKKNHGCWLITGSWTVLLACNLYSNTSFSLTFFHYIDLPHRTNNVRLSRTSVPSDTRKRRCSKREKHWRRQTRFDRCLANHWSLIHGLENTSPKIFHSFLRSADDWLGPGTSHRHEDDGFLTVSALLENVGFALCIRKYL